MHGVRIQRDFAGDLIRRSPEGEVRTCGLGKGEPLILDGLTDFHHFFSPILPKIGHLYWVIDDLQLYLSEETQEELVANGLPSLESLILEEQSSPGNWLITKPGILDHYGRSLVDDWMDFFGVRQPPSTIEVFKDAYFSGPGRAASKQFIADTADVYVACVDGVLWEFYAKDFNLVEQVVAHNSQLEGLRIIERQLIPT